MFVIRNAKGGRDINLPMSNEIVYALAMDSHYKVGR
jgi:hypothetical protein